MIINFRERFHRCRYFKSLLIPSFIFFTVSIIFCYRIFHHFDYLGAKCWDQFAFWNAVPRVTILQFHQFPLWNPYVNGGNVLLAHPHSPFLSPFYVFVVIFGVIAGLKLQVIFHLVIGMIGMYILVSNYGFALFSRYFAAFLYMCSSVYFLHIAEGHTEWFAMAFVPWLVYYYVRACEKKSFILGAVISLSLVFLSGSVDVFTILLILMPVFALLQSFKIKAIKPLKIIILVYLCTFLLCSIKILPMIEFLNKYPRFSETKDCVNFSTVIKMILDRNQSGYYALNKDVLKEMFGIRYRWHEYGSYIGVIPLLFIIAGFFIGFKRYWPFVITGIISLFICLGKGAPVDIWAFLHQFPIYNNLKVHSRFIMGFIFFSTILGALSFSCFERFCVAGRKKILAIIPFTILLITFFDLWIVNARILDNLSAIPPIEIKKNLSFTQKYRKINLFEDKGSLSSVYPVLLSNAGVLEGYEVVSIKRGDILSVSDEGYKGEAFLLKQKGRVEIEYFSPNKIVVNARAAGPDTLIINQNFYNGWKVKVDNTIYPARNSDGFLSFPVEGDKKMQFFYLPDSFLIGGIVTFLSVLFIILRLKLIF